MSEVKVNKISPRTNCGTVQLGDSGDTITIPAGATITNNGTQTGFGRTGTVDWETTPKTASFTAGNGEGYFVNTTSGAITVTLPAGSAGDIISLADYAATWDTNNVTVTPNGTDKIGGANVSVTLNTEGQSVTFVFTDSTQGWINTMDSTSNVRGNNYVVATGGTITTCGDFKVHTFTGPGTFTVTSTAAAPADNTADYFVIGGGGGAGYGTPSIGSGGGGAGGFRLSNDLCMPAPLTSPLANPTGITLSVQAYPITVGAGGSQSTPSPGIGNDGSNSTFSTITSEGGGGGGSGGSTGRDGGSGGGSKPGTGGSGNTPPVSPPQGNNGGSGAPNGPAGGGGGGGAVGVNGTPGGAGDGGAGSFIAASFGGTDGTTGPVCGARYFAGGGAGGPPVGSGGTGGVGGGAPSSASGGINDGATNTGSGGGGSWNSNGGGGGSGIIKIRYKFQ